VLRVPPHDIPAEQAVLGGLMLVSAAFDDVADIVAEDDFYRREHQIIFRAIASLVAASQPLDAVTLGEWFERHGESLTMGGPAYLAELANNTPSAANIAAYAQIVRDKSVLRQLIEVSTKTAGEAFQPDGQTTPEIIEAAEQRVFQIAETNARGRRQVAPLRSALAESVRLLSERYANPGGLTGLSSGFVDLDNLTLGLQRQDLIIVAARPSMGKTALALNIAEAVGVRAKQPVLIFSMEMSSAQLATRLTSAVARVDQTAMRTGNVQEEEWRRIGDAIGVLSQAPIHIDETPALSPGEIRSRARRIKRAHGLGLVIVDYLQLMQVPGNKENRATEVAEISRSLKAMAKELDVPVVALSQLNRSVEQRNDKRPVMSDLRESGAIEQDADLILLLYRDEVYDKNSPARGTAEVIIGKQRNGPIDTVRLAFLGQYTRFENYVAS
jgi:replicative DNA helicase